MAKPLYIVCADSGVEGKENNLISFFNVLEKVTLAIEALKQSDPSGPPKVVIHPLMLWAVAVWMKEDGDEARQFESHFVVIRPDGAEIIKTEPKRFGFVSGKYLTRFVLRCQLTVTSFPEGFLRIQNRVREVGKTEWLSQEYPILVEVRTMQQATTGDEGGTHSKATS